MKTSPSDPAITNFNNSLKVLSQPKEMIQEFFMNYHYPDAVQYLQRLLKLAFRKSQKKNLNKQASNLLFYYQNLILLLEISWILAQHDNENKAANITCEFEDQKPLLDVSIYALEHHADRAFEFFPRELTAEEILRPYKVFPKLFKEYSLSEWKDMLDNFFHHVIGRYRSEISSNEFNLFTMPKLLGKMIAACHLIYVRERDQKKPATNTTPNVQSEQKEPEQPTGV